MAGFDRNQRNPGSAGVVLALCLGLALLLLGRGASAQEPGFETDWRNVAESGLTGVSMAVVELPQGGYHSYRMDGPLGMAAAFSQDGLTWTGLEGFVPPLPGEGLFVSNPWVFITTDGNFRMIYEARDEAGNRRLYSALSPDGLAFTNEGLVMAGDEEDLSPPQTEMFLSVPTGLRLPDGSLRM